jgi:hypothetical protein
MIGVASLFAVAASFGAYFWMVRRPPKLAAAALPASARMLLQPFRKADLNLTLPANGELGYRVEMRAGATLIYSWTASTGTVSFQFADQQPGRSREAHGAFVAQSSGWYRWRWNNSSDAPIDIHLKLNGYYEPASLPYDR